MSNETELSTQQEKFCRLCAEGKTVTEAEQLSGYSRGYGWKLVKKEHIRRAIAVQRNPSGREDDSIFALPMQAEQKKTTAAKKSEILGFLTDVMRDDKDADIRTRMRAAELLGKRESLFDKNKKQPTQTEQRTIIVDDLP